MDLSAFLDEFRAEAAEHLRTLDAQLLALERDPTATAPIRAMFISCHTIKGGAGRRPRRSPRARGRPGPPARPVPSAGRPDGRPPLPGGRRSAGPDRGQ